MQKIKFLDLLYFEDELALGENNKSLIHTLFKSVCIVNNVETAIETFCKNKPNIIIIVGSGESNNSIHFIEEIRSKDINIPIVLISDLKEFDSLLNLMNLQLDGFLPAPISLDSLSRCLNNCLKKIEFKEVFNLDKNISYNLTNKELFVSSKYIKLGKKVNDLLYLFVTNANKTISKERIEHEIWDDYVVSDSSIKNLIGNLRKIIGKEKITNIAGVGWKLNTDNYR